MSLLPWHERTIAEFDSLRTSGRLPHGLLIHGPEGWGDRQLANRLALRLLGMDETADARMIAHPDLHWVQPDGAVIKVDDIRALAGFAVGTRQSAPCKVAVVESAHLLNLNAANALLKTLEEPPRDTYLLLATSRRGRLLPTIVSRCQALGMHPDSALAMNWLQEQTAETAAALAARLFEYGGAPLPVAAALEQEESLLLDALHRVGRSSAATAELGDLLALDPEQLTGRWYRYCAALLAGEGPIAALQPVDEAALCGFVDELVGVRRQLLFTNSANARLLVERLAVRWRLVCQGNA
ncbi:MAG: hypothetical protein R3E82_04820 [Pseudomonadales bacterium]|nr:hypothetical protein [Pseudomonadales bacterium]